MTAPSTVCRAASLVALTLPLLAGCILARPGGPVNTAGTLVDPPPNPIVTPGPTPKPNPELEDALAPATPAGTKDQEVAVEIEGVGKVTWLEYETKRGVELWLANPTKSNISGDVAFRVDEVPQSSGKSSRVVPPGTTKRVAWLESYKATGGTIIWTPRHLIGDLNAVHDDAYAYAVPWRADGTFTVGGLEGDGLEHAVRIALPEGTPVLAARDGEVSGLRSSAEGDDGVWLELRHSDGTQGRYAYLKPGSEEVNLGMKVKRGEKLALSGATGGGRGGALAFRVYKPVDVRTQRLQSVAFKWRTAAGADPVEAKVGTAVRAWEFPAK